MEDTLKFTEEQLGYIQEALVLAGNNWYDDYAYGHLNLEEENTYKNWERLRNAIYDELVGTPLN